MTILSRLLLSACCMAWPALAGAAEPGGSAAPDDPQRIIAIGGSITEIIYALGAQERLAAVDSASLYPPRALETHPNVGYMRALSAEPVLSVAPDLILAIADAGPPEVIRQMRQVGVPVLTIRDEPSVRGAHQKIRAVAGAVGLEREGEQLVARMEREYRTLSERLKAVKIRPKVLFLLSTGNGPPLAAGAGTSAHSMIQLAGGRNVMERITGYKTVTPEAIVAAAPEIIVATRRTFARYGSKEKLLSLPDLAATPAAAAGRLLVFDGLYLVGFGPRTVAAVRELATHFHPDFFDSQLKRGGF